MMSDFRGDGGSKMTPKFRTLEDKNWTLRGVGGQKSSKIVGHRLRMNDPLFRPTRLLISEKTFHPHGY